MTMFELRKGFGQVRVFFGVPESYGNSPGEVLGLIGPYGNRGGRTKGTTYAVMRFDR